MSPTSVEVEGPSGRIETYLALPEKSSGIEPLLLLCHGLPLNRNGGRVASLQLPELGERLAAESGWAVGGASLRGVGDSPGTFSAGGWKEDLKIVIDTLIGDRSTVVLTGFGIGGALALRVAVEDDRVRGVAASATASDLITWCGEPNEFARACVRAGVVGNEPLGDPASLVADVIALDPIGAVGLFVPKRLMLIYGSDDPIVPERSSKDLLDAAQGRAELRVIQGAGHWLRADPRMFATLLGWLDRQH